MKMTPPLLVFEVQAFMTARLGLHIVGKSRGGPVALLICLGETGKDARAPDRQTKSVSIG